MMSRLLTTRRKYGSPSPSSSPVSWKSPAGGEGQWDEIKCPICMEHPHNAVLLLCSSYDNGCRPFMCDTSYRHSNCLDQYRSTSKPSPLPPSNNDADAAGSWEFTSWADWGEDHLEEDTFAAAVDNDYDEQHLTCPLCRGTVYGWEVVEPVRRYLNAKPRDCSSEGCGFVGGYYDLRKHARSDHPLVRPAQAHPERQQAWARMEQEEEAAVPLGNSDDSGHGDDFMVTLRLTRPGNENVDLEIEIPGAMLAQQISSYNRTGHIEDEISIDGSSGDDDSGDDSMLSSPVTSPDTEDVELCDVISRAVLTSQSYFNQTKRDEYAIDNINIDRFRGMHEDSQARVRWNGRRRWNRHLERNPNMRRDVDFSRTGDDSNESLFRTRNRYGCIYGDNQDRPIAAQPRVRWNGQRRWNQNLERNLNMRRDVDFSSGRNLCNRASFRASNRYGAMYGDNNQTWSTGIEHEVRWNGRRHLNRNFERNLNVRRDVNFSRGKNHSNRTLFQRRNRHINFATNTALDSYMDGQI